MNASDDLSSEIDKGAHTNSYQFTTWLASRKEQSIHKTYINKVIWAQESPYFDTIKNMLIMQQARNWSSNKPMSIEEREIFRNKCDEKVVDICSKYNLLTQVVYIENLKKESKAFYKRTAK